MLGIQYKHNVEPDGSVSLAYYRYADDVTGEVVAELVDGKLLWHADPQDDFIHAIVTETLDDIMRDWFLEYYGIKPKFRIPVDNMEELWRDT